ncbi:MAG: stage II sporulation protein R [bacterium]|nr:stage II sporulation protein R [bacterium]
MRRISPLLFSVVFFLFACCFFALADRSHDEAIAASLSPSVLRFHVLAASDSEEDQNLKLKVRDFFLDTLHKALPQTADKANILSYVENQKATLVESLNAFLAQNGSSDTATLEIASIHFPQRRYGALCFPSGQYEALRICIGEAKGHNWWCVLYPSLCFTDESGPYLPASSCELLKDLVGEGTYSKLLSKEAKPAELRFFFLTPLSSF